MKKIVSLFQRNYEGDRLVRDEITPGAEWVIAGEGIATRKFDGTCCMLRDGILYRRYEVKPGARPPLGFEPAGDVDPVTGKQQGWISVDPNRPENRWHMEAYEALVELPPDGTYELCGPKIQGNPEGFASHILLPHGADVLQYVPTAFEGLRDYLGQRDIEGIVWHHYLDGRMVKIKTRDFGLTRRRERSVCTGS